VSPVTFFVIQVTSLSSRFSFRVNFRPQVTVCLATERLGQHDLHIPYPRNLNPNISLSTSIMPGYSTLSRSSSQTSSTHTHDSIRRRSGVHQSSTSLRKVLTGSPQTVGYHPQDITQRVGSEAAYPSAHTTASSSSNPTHFTAISSRSHHSPPIPSCTS
jgi:hypothetical protein